MSSSSGFSFTQPKLPTINRLEALSFDDYYAQAVANVPLPQFPSRTLAQLVALVDQGNSSQISILEWLEVIENEQYWQGLSENETLDACRAIWLAICINEVLGNIAFFKAALAIQGQPSTLVTPLLSSMEIVRGVSGLSETNISRLDWIKSIKLQDWQTIAQQCYQEKQTPTQRVKKLMLPNANNYLIELPQQLVHCAPQQLSNDDQFWLEACFEGFKTTHQKITFCEHLIERYHSNLNSGCIKRLIESHCLPSAEQSYWYDLQHSSQLKLKQLFNLSSYYELKSLINLLCSPNCSERLSIDDRQQNQMQGRMKFWSNYSKQFDRVRAIVPNGTYDVLIDGGTQLTEQISVFKEQSEKDAEVFIFSLSNIIIVEVLRGELGETRFYKNSKWNAERLFDAEFSSLAEIRELAQVEVHDHVLLWQYYCEKLLRTKFGVIPNEGLTHFNGLSQKIGRYVTDRGLPTPPPIKVAERTQMLEQWLGLLWRYEFSTAKLGKLTVKDSNSMPSFVKAEVARKLGDETRYMNHLKEASALGNAEASHRLGLTMLKSAADAKGRRKGEVKILQAARMGHKQAESDVKRFEIKPDTEVSQLLEVALNQVDTSSHPMKPDFRKWTNTKLALEAKECLKQRLRKDCAISLLYILEELEARASGEVSPRVANLLPQAKSMLRGLKIEFDQ